MQKILRINHAQILNIYIVLISINPPKNLPRTITINTSCNCEMGTTITFLHGLLKKSSGAREYYDKVSLRKLLLCFALKLCEIIRHNVQRTTKIESNIYD